MMEWNDKLKRPISRTASSRMLPLPRIAFPFVRLLPLALLLVLPLHGQNPPQNNLQPQVVPGRGNLTVITSETPYPFPLPGREITRDLTRSLQQFQEGRTLEAFRLLQDLLENREDFLIPPEDVSISLVDQTLRKRIIGVMSKIPADSLAEYEQLYGAEARSKINAALDASDWKTAEQLSVKYLFTHSGRELTERLAFRHLDHGEFISAALVFERLLTSLPHQQSHPPRLVALLAWSYLAGGETSLARAVLDRESTSLRTGEISWGHQSWTLPLSTDELLKRLSSQIPSGSPLISDDWLLPRQSTTSSSASQVGPPALQERWSYSTARWKDAVGEDSPLETAADPEDPLDDLFNRNAARNLPLVPASTPLIVDDLAIFRTAARLRAVTLSTGRIRWQSAESDATLAGLQHLISPSTQQAGHSRQAVIAALETRAWSNLSHGTLTTDGLRVYSLADLGVWGNSTSPNNLHEDHASAPRDFNRLVANDLRSGKILWQVGGPPVPDSPSLAGWYFLGPPLPLRGTLYLLGEHQHDIHLVALDPETGRPFWTQPLMMSRQVPLLEFSRRSLGITPVAADGILLCPTGMQALVAVDLTSRSILWGRQHNESANFIPNLSQFPNAPFRTFRPPNNDLPILHRWIDPYLQLVGDRLLYAPAESDQLSCLNLWTGKLLWQLPRERGLFVAGEHDGKVLIVGRDLIEAVSLADGQPAWKQPVSITAPSGKGYFADDLYHLPLMNGELLSLDIQNGQILARRTFPGTKPLGNLVAARGMILSQSYDTLTSFQPLDAYAAEQHVALDRPPTDSPGWSLRGMLHLFRRNPAQAAADFQQALQTGSQTAATSSAVRDLWLSSLLEGIRIDPGTYLPLIDPAQAPLALPSRWGGLWAYHASNRLLEEKQFSPALDLLLQALSQQGDASPVQRSNPKQQPSLDRLAIDWNVRREDWISGRIAEVFQQTPAEQHPALEQRLQSSWDQLASQPAEQRRLQMILRDLPIGARFADLDLARGSDPLPLERELWLIRILHSGTAPQRPFAAAQLAAALLKRQDLSGATPYLTLLHTDYKDLPAHRNPDNSTLNGSELLVHWERESLITPPEDPARWPSGKIRVATRLHKQPEAPPRSSIPLFLDLRNPPELRLQITQSDERLRSLDPFGQVRWEYPLARSLRQHSGGNWFHAQIGSLLLMTNAAQLVCIDLSRIPDDREAQRLWARELIDPTEVRGYDPSTPPRLFQTIPERPIRILDTLGQTGDQILSATEELILLYREGTIVGLDPLTGEIRWQRLFIKSLPEALPWGRKLFLSNNPDDPADCSLLSSTDGRLLGRRHWNKLPENSEIPVIHPQLPTHIVATSRGALQVQQLPDNSRRVALIDPENFSLLWEKTVPPTAQFSLTRSFAFQHWSHPLPPELALLTPGGAFEILNLADGKPRLSLRISEVDIPPPFTLLSFPDQDLLAFGTTGQLSTHIHQSAAGKGRLFYGGTILALDRATSSIAWKKTTSESSQIFDVSPSHPLLVIHSQDHSAARTKNGPPRPSHHQLQFLDRRTGRDIYTATDLTILGLSSLQIDPPPPNSTSRLLKYALIGRPDDLEIDLTLTDKPLGGDTPDIQIQNALPAVRIPPAAAPKPGDPPSNPDNPNQK